MKEGSYKGGKGSVLKNEHILYEEEKEKSDGRTNKHWNDQDRSLIIANRRREKRKTIKRTQTKRNETGNGRIIGKKQGRSRKEGREKERNDAGRKRVR